MFALPGTSAAHAARQHERVTEMLALPEVKWRVVRQGLHLETSTPRKLAERIGRDVARWREQTRAAGIDLG